jgi:hypothetical protein
MNERNTNHQKEIKTSMKSTTTTTKKPTFGIIRTPWSRAIWPSLHTPDTKGDNPSNKYQVDLEPIDQQDFIRFMGELETILEGERFTKRNPENPPVRENKDGVEIIRTRSAYRPMGFDTKNNPLPPDVAVGGGSIIRVLAKYRNYGKGYALDLLQYQVKELVSGDNREPAFEPVDDGFEVESFGNTSNDDRELDI